MTTLDLSMHPGQEPTMSPRDRAMLAHDLRGALHGVIGGVAVLETAEAPPALREQLARIGAAARTVARLVEDLIGVGGAPARRGAPCEVDVHRFLRHLDRRWSGEARERRRALRIVAAPDLPGVLKADLVSLARALGNLVGNALRHARDAEVRICARRAADGGIVLEVIDAGPGIPLPVIDQVLRPGPMAVADSGGAHGLGLHIARALAAEMGAAFALENLPGGGARAGLAFPPALCAEAPSQPPAVLEPGRADLAGLRILIAEDNPTNQLVAVQMLRALNADVTATSDGVEALERFEAAAFDLVVVDIEMPRMSGLDVIRTIRARGDARAATPVVALTAYALSEHRERIAAAGANGLVSKPITSVAALGQALRAHVAPGPTRGDVPAAAPAPARARDEPVADLAVFDALCVAIGDGMMAELLDKVVADLTQARRDLETALAPLDRKPIRTASHILISVAGAIGATRLQACARALNIAAHGAHAAGGRDLAGDVRRCLVEIDAAVAFARSRRAAA